jgi:DNA-binding transcriptional LysR family regulator
MELRHLRYFVGVAEMENVSRAALKLHVAQPSLSRQIRNLEEELGVRLLERTAKSVRLTEPGRAFLEEARTILKHAEDAVLKVRRIAGTLETELRVGDWPLGTGRIMPALLRAYQEAMPNVHVKPHDWSVYQNIAGVRDGRLQLAIVVPPPQYQEHLASIFARVNPKPRIVEEHDGWTGLFSAVGASTGVAICSDVFSYVFGDRVKQVRLTPEPKRVVIGIITRKGKLSPATERFCQCAREAFGALR